ncbi:MAG: dihydropyrimidine dehydrogenase, partial [Pygmaiobacter sp.]
MPNMSPIKQKMPTQAPEVRRCNFEEVELGYTLQQAVAEAERCLGCNTQPCVSGCPVNVNIPDFIEKLRCG